MPTLTPLRAPTSGWHLPLTLLRRKPEAKGAQALPSTEVSLSGTERSNDGKRRVRTPEENGRHGWVPE